MSDLKFSRAGTAEPPPLPTASTSDADVLGSAGLVNQGSPSNVDDVAAAFSAAAASSAAAAMSKRDSDWHSLMGGNTPAGGGATQEPAY